jgi:GTPase SAR1 family protein
MGFDPSTIQDGIKDRPRKILIYGPPKIGKSTLTGATKDALMIPTEDRVDHIQCKKTPIPNQLEDVFEVIQYLANEKHPFKRLIIDTIDWLEPLIHDYVCRKNGFKSITDDHNKETAFQKGLKYHAVAGWKEFLAGLDYLRDSGIGIVLVAHDAIIKHDPPDGDSYDKSVMKIDKNALSVVEEWADMIGYYNRKVFVKTEEGRSGKAVNANNRMLHLSGNNPAFISGNSFGFGDFEVELDHAPDIMEALFTSKVEIEAKEQKAKTKKEEK